MADRPIVSTKSAPIESAPNHLLRWEAHACLPLHPQVSLSPLLRYLESGVSYISVNVGMDMNPLPQVMRVLAHLRETINQHPRLVLAGSISEIRTAAERGLLSVGFDLEGALPLLESPAMVSLYRALGVRQMHLAYNRNNSIAGGCHDHPQGLTALGREVVTSMNQAGILVDCAHMSERASLELIECSESPVIVSHANPASLVTHQRNMSDVMIDQIAEGGGVICLTGVNLFLGEAHPRLETLLDHLCYVAERAGPSYVGIGLDISFSQEGVDDTPPDDVFLGEYDPNRWWPSSAGYQGGLSEIMYLPPETWRSLPAALERRGFNQEERALILGENMARVMTQVEALSANHDKTLASLGL